MQIKNRLAEMHDDITAWRRDFHENPEILFDVHRTAGIVAEKLKDAVREADTVARLGGDEFTVIISSFSDVQSIHRVAMKLVGLIQESMAIGPNQLYITSSIGVSIYPDDGDTAEALYYLSEYHLMTGNLVGGINFLQRALALPELQEIQRIRFEARIDFIREYMSEEQLKQLQRSQPVGASARNSG